MDYINSATAAGFAIVLNLHNYNRYAINAYDVQGQQISGYAQHTLYDGTLTLDHLRDIWVKLAKCCTPVPGDTIVGFVTRGDGVSVHRGDCSNVHSLLASQPDRIIEVEWAPSSSSVFLVQIQVEALDRARLLSDVTRMLSDQHVNILSASVTTSRDRIALSRFTFEMGDPKHLGSVLNSVRGIEGVYDVYRVTSARPT